MKLTGYKEFINGIYWRDITVDEYLELSNYDQAQFHYEPTGKRLVRCALRNRGGHYYVPE